MKRSNISRLFSLLLVVLSCVSLSSCQKINPEPTEGLQDHLVFEREKTQIRASFTSAAQVEALSKSIPTEYVIGSGDVLSLTVVGRPEISSESLLVGPDGDIVFPRIGTIHVEGKTRTEVIEDVDRALESLYVDPEFTLNIRTYRNNKAYILGRVSSPGIIHFSGKGTLIEAISLAGGVPTVGANRTYHTECSIIRGDDQIIWIDLDDLLVNGNMALNAAIRPNDVIFIPEAKQAFAYTMGAIGQKGPIALRKDMTFMDALMQSGGPTKDANLEKAFLIRWDGRESTIKVIDFTDMVSRGDLTENYILKDNDIIFIADKKIARWNHYIQQITPTLRMISLAKSTGNTVSIID